MRVLVSGSTGLIGSALARELAAGGVPVTRLVRTPPHMAEAKIHWDPDAGRIDARRLAGHDAVVHLAGENIADGRWTQEKRRRIRESRVAGTRLLAEALAGLDDPPKVLACASAVGFYGDRGDELLTEVSEPGSGFLADVCRAWEEAAEPARQKGIRVVHLRFGVVLDPRGGALRRMLGPFRLGLGARIGSGRQYMSWIALRDAVAAIVHVLATGSLVGPVNVVAPNAVTNREFTRTLGRVLRRPTLLAVPAFAARLAFGELADALLLASTRAAPLALMESGFKFQYETLEPALRALLTDSARGAPRP